MGIRRNLYRTNHTPRITIKTELTEKNKINFIFKLKCIFPVLYANYIAIAQICKQISTAPFYLKSFYTVSIFLRLREKILDQPVQLSISQTYKHFFFLHLKTDSERTFARRPILPSLIVKS